MRRILFVIMLGAAIASVLTHSAHAQDSTLDRVHALIATGRFTDAGNALSEWERRFRDPRSAAAPADRARSLFLRALITLDAEQAEDMFVSVVLSYPSSAVAPQALLRLGQLLLTRNEPRRALAYLERLRSDYPGAPARETGMLWLARAQLAHGLTDAACVTATEAIRATTDENLRPLIQLERDRSCRNERLVRNIPHA